MAYTRPAPTAANIDFTGATVYVRPLPTAADFSFFVTPPSTFVQVAPLRPVNFGTPAVATNRTFAVQGFLATKFGRPSRVSYSLQPHTVHFMVYRLRPVKFGTPSI